MQNKARMALVALAFLVLLVSGARADWVTTTVPTGDYPVAAAVNPVSNKIYVANPLSNNVMVIDGATNDTTTVAAGTYPWAVAVNPGTNKIYVSNMTSNDVTVIDGSDNTTSAVITGTTPWGLAVNPVTNKIYVANTGSDDVTVIDGITNATTVIPAGDYPRAVAVNPVTNKIYVANYNSGNVTVIDGATNDTATVVAGTGPCAVAVNTVTNKIYIANYGSNNVTVIDGVTNDTTTVAAGTSPTGIAINPVTNKIYVANYNSANVTVIDGATNATATVAVGATPHAVAVNPVTNNIYIPNHHSDNVTVIDGATNSTTTVTVGANPNAVAVNPVSNKIYVTNQSSNNVTVIDGADNTANNVAAGTTPYRAAVNPVTNKIYVTNNGSNNVTVIDGATNATTTVTTGTNPCAVAVNPVTNKIFVSNNGSNNVTVIDGATNATTTVAVGTNPAMVAVNTVTNKIYVANQGGVNVTVIDGATNTTTTVNAIAKPCGVAVNPVTNKIYVSDGDNGNVAVIDGATNNIIATIVTVSVSPGFGGCTIAVNPITNKIYAASYYGHTVTVIDGATNATTNVSLGGLWTPCNPAVNPVTNKVYVGSNWLPIVTVIDGITNATTTIVVGANPYSVAVNPVTNKIYAGIIGNNVTVIDGATNATTTVSAGSIPYFVAVNPVTNKIYVPNYNSSNVTVIDEAREWETGVEATINYLPQHAVYSNKPDLYGTASVGWVPSRTSIMYVLNDWMTGQQPWETAFISNPKGYINWQYNWANDSLLWGENFINIVPLESQCATTNNLGLGTPFAGNRLTYPIYYMDNVAPSQASLISPANGIITHDSLVTFNWNAATDNYSVGQYRLQCASDMDFTQNLFDTTVYDTALSVMSTIFNAPIYWRVKAIDAAGNQGSYSAVRQFEIDLSPPDVPGLIAPYDDNWIDNTSIVFAWTAVAKKAKGAAVEYVLQIDTADAFTAPIIEDTTANLLDTFNLTEGNYYWRVMAYDLAGNYGTYSGYRAFGIDTTAPLIQYVKAVPDDSGEPYGPYEMTANVFDLSGVKSARLFTQINGGSWNSTPMLFSADSLRDTIPQLNPASDETLAVSYYITATDLLGHESTSMVYSFRAIGPLGVAGESSMPLPSVFALNGAYPNPSSGHTIIKYQMPKPANVKLEIYNVSGQLVKSINKGLTYPGYHAIKWDASKVPAGVYFYRLTAGYKQYAQKLVIIK